MSAVRSLSDVLIYPKPATFAFVAFLLGSSSTPSAGFRFANTNWFSSSLSSSGARKIANANGGDESKSENTGFAVPPKAIVFDVDGTLADSWKLGYDATVVVLENNGLPTIDERTYHECTRYSTPERMALHAKAADGDGEVADNDRSKEVGNRLAAEFDDLYVGLVTTEIGRAHV